MSILLSSWQEKMKETFPNGQDTVSFICPACKNTASIEDFKAAGLSENDAPQQCLFRSTNPERCNWAAYGLFRGPEIVIMPDGSEVPVFAFATPDDPATEAVTG